MKMEGALAQVPTRSLPLPVLYSSTHDSIELRHDTPFHVRRVHWFSGLPQRPQNLVPGAYELPQDLQTTSTERGGRQSSEAAPMGMPHLPQKRMPAGYCV